MRFNEIYNSILCEDEITKDDKMATLSKLSVKSIPYTAVLLLKDDEGRESWSSLVHFNANNSEDVEEEAKKKFLEDYQQQGFDTDDLYFSINVSFVFRGHVADIFNK